MSDSVRFQADESRAVYVGKFDQDIWLSIQVHGGGAHCVIPKEEAFKMLKTLEEFLTHMEDA